MYRKQLDFLWIVFLPLSFFWAVVAKLRRLFWGKGGRCKLPVICIGNLHSGGSGKTPVVMEIAKYLSKKNSVIVSRGYKRKTKSEVCEVDSKALDGPSRFGDEAWLLSQETGRPVFVGASRLKVARVIEETFSEAILVLDDGFQHLGLEKDLSFVVIHADRDYFDSFCLPLGEMREPFTALNKADAVILIGGQDDERKLIWRNLINDRFSDLSLFEFEISYSELLGDSPADVSGKKAIGFSGIAHPERFAASLRECADVRGIRIFPDHYSYLVSDAKDLINRYGESSDTFFVTTQKDWYKVRSYFQAAHVSLFYLGQSCRVPKEFWTFLENCLENRMRKME